MVNDMRLEVKRTGQMIDQRLPEILHNTDRAVNTVNQRLPQILVRLDQITKLIDEHLPATLEKTQTITDTLVELAGDIKDYQELLGGVHAVTRDQSVVRYANSVLKFLDGQEGVIGLKKGVTGKGLKSAVPVKEWVAGARKKAALLTVLAKDRPDFLRRLCTSAFGSTWHIHPKGHEPVPLHDWIRQNHEESKNW
jgi:hypothetical protein